MLAIATAAAVGVSLGSFVPAAADSPRTLAEAAAAAKPEPEKVVERADRFSAALAARVQGSRVEVTGLRSESSSTFVNPDGSLTTESYLSPVRVRSESGAGGGWVPVNYELVKSDNGGWAPKASPHPVVFSGGGDGPVATLDGSTGKSQVSAGWDDVLPEPVVSGSTATYALGDGRDLVLRATADGFEQSLVIRERPAEGSLEASEGVRFPLRLQADGLSLSAVEADGVPTGGYQLLDAAGAARFVIAPPLAYPAPAAADATQGSGGKSDADPSPSQTAAPSTDSTDSTDSDPTTGSGVPVDAEPVPLPSELVAGGGAAKGDGDGAEADTVEVIAPPELLMDPDTTFPLVLDPLVGVPSANGSTWVQNGSSTAQYASPYLKIGYQTSAATRSFLKFNTGGLANFSGAYVSAASLDLWTWQAAACTARTMYAYPVSASYTNNTVVWSNQPSYNSSATYQGSSVFSHGFDASCPDAWGSVDVTAMTQAWADGTLPSYGIMLRAFSETSADYVKGFCSFNPNTSGTCQPADRAPKLTITYRTIPTAPSGQVSSPGGTGPDGNVYVTSLTPTLRAAVANADSSTSGASFEVSYDPAYAGEGTGVIWTGSGVEVAPGSYSQATVGSGLLTNGTHPRWRARGWVKDSAGNKVYGPWTGYRKMWVDTTVPAAPSISCSSYPSGVWSASVGSTTCTLDTTASDGVGYWWSLDDPTFSGSSWTWVPDATWTGAAKTITINPVEGRHTLYTRTRDKAVNSSTITTYTFGVGNGGLLTPSAIGGIGTSTQRAVGLTAQSSSARTQVTYQYALGAPASPTWTNVPTANVTPPGSGTPISAWPQSGTTSGSVANYSQLDWNVAATVAAAGGVDGPVQLRACFTQAGANQWCTTATQVVLGRSSFSGSSATQSVGPGTVSLLTGDFTMDETDAAFGGMTIGRTHTSLAPPGTSTGPDGVFGAGWTASGMASDVFAVVKRADVGVVQGVDVWGVRRPRRGVRRGLWSAWWWLDRLAGGADLGSDRDVQSVVISAMAARVAFSSTMALPAA